jgi:hypothetical protein
VLLIFHPAVGAWHWRESHRATLRARAATKRELTALGVAMFGSKKKRKKLLEEYQHQERKMQFAQRERAGAEIYKRLYELKSMDRARLPH